MVSSREMLIPHDMLLKMAQDQWPCPVCAGRKFIRRKGNKLTRQKLVQVPCPLCSQTGKDPRVRMLFEHIDAAKQIMNTQTKRANLLEVILDVLPKEVAAAMISEDSDRAEDERVLFGPNHYIDDNMATMLLTKVVQTTIDTLQTDQGTSS